MAFRNITIEIELRPCMVNNRKALFHNKYIESDEQYIESDGVEASIKIREDIKGLVEYEDGTLDLVSYKNIKFIDKKHQQYCWDNNREGVKHG
ncbi:MAG: hypothetical protein ACLTA8_01835 [Intestinibacter bartlettii]|jgi:hypothetical protein|uniref:hypothetical protein n=1 Tax=Intestinibacter bartlettii TaxID=261299 RepID=UPI00399412CA